MASSNKKSLFQQETDIAAAVAWVTTNQEKIPSYVYSSVMLLCTLRASLAQVKERASSLLSLFRRELGVAPKSERGQLGPDGGGPNPKKTDEELLAAMKERRAKLAKQIRRYEDRLGKLRKKRQKPSALSTEGTFGPNPAAAIANQPEFERSCETVFSGNLAESNTKTVNKSVKKNQHFDNPIGLHSSNDERSRFDFSVSTKKITLIVETVTDPRTGKSVTASTDDIGPPNSQSTWSGIANAIIAVIGYAIPINRLAAMLSLSCPYFTSARICAHLKFAAELFLPIYTWLGEELADSEVLQGDDTKCRVIEIQNSLKNGGDLAEPVPDSLIAKVAAIFGRVFPKKRKKGTKRSLNVSTVIGKSRAEDPRSYIFFFRTHLGSFGDLLGKMLDTRSPQKKKITIISDQSTTNLLPKRLYSIFDIVHAGCAAHARRPFYRLKDKDVDLCYWMLSAFLILEQIEDRLDELGRTAELINRYRQRYALKIWVAILKRCESVVRGEKIYGHHWEKTSQIPIACQYIITHYAELTRYLGDPRLPSNNNLSERVLRWDKIMQDSSKFRKTEAGRLHVDILRTIVHTCSAAKVEIRDYLLFVFNYRDAIAETPELFTPYAFSQRPEA